MALQPIPYRCARCDAPTKAPHACRPASQAEERLRAILAQSVKQGHVSTLAQVTGIYRT